MNPPSLPRRRDCLINFWSQLVIATAIGVAFGPVGAKWFQPDMFGNEDTVTREFCRLVIAIQVMAAGVALPKAYLRKEFLSLLILLVPGMIWMWLSSSLFVWALIPGLNFVSSTLGHICGRQPIITNFVARFTSAGSVDDCFLLHAHRSGKSKFPPSNDTIVQGHKLTIFDNFVDSL